MNKDDEKIHVMKLYSIKDELVGFTPPIPLPSDTVAKRYFMDQLIGNPTMKNSPKDFSIWAMGTFETHSGRIKSKEPELLERGKINDEKTNV